jgi:alpha-galactosidase
LDQARRLQHAAIVGSDQVVEARAAQATDRSDASFDVDAKESPLNNKFLMLARRVALLGFGTLCVAANAPAQKAENSALTVSVNSKDGTYQIATRGGQPIFTSRTGVELDHVWMRSTDYARHEVSESKFSDDLGTGHSISLKNSGSPDKPDLIATIQVYDNAPYATLQLQIANGTKKSFNLNCARVIEATGDSLLNLGGSPSADRVLSDSFSEDRPAMKLYDLGKAPKGMHRAVGSQMIYNRESKQSLLIGALTADKLLTYLHLQASGDGPQTKVDSFNADFSGTTEIQKDFDLRDASPRDQLEISLPIEPGVKFESEKIMFAAGSDYEKQLVTYGEAIHKLHHPRIPDETPMGWWSWTAYYGNINEGETLVNADWQAAHLKSFGYNFFQVDEGYQYARGEYITPNATQYPNGMRSLGHHVVGDGLVFGVWTAPFEVTTRAWVYENHKDWLVHNAKGEPIPTTLLWRQKSDQRYALDTTNPGAQEYLRQTYRTLVREWGVRFIKLDFMDSSAIEGFMYRPHTTALEALRIGLQVIRDAVGDDVVLDKDGSPMLTPVGLVDTGRISADTAHSFEGTKTAAPGIAARFYMHRNYFIDDPDAFNTVAETFADHTRATGVYPLNLAQASVALSAVSGGMYEIGDDMVVMGAQKDRLALIENEDLLNIAKVGRASTPVDLLTYEPEDELPSIFFLRESARQSILTVFNWTKSPRSHTLKLADLGLTAGHSFTATDVFDPTAAVSIAGATLQIDNQPAESVRVFKIIDGQITAVAPKVTAKVPSEAKTGEMFDVSADADAEGVPALSYSWDFSDGIMQTGRKVKHTYTAPGSYEIHLTAPGVDGVSYTKSFTMKVDGALRAYPNLLDNRRFRDPADHE